ncbi:MAG: GNAT family N-acetyltransferase [Muribaculaceae bacterium]|nr:GNAT family N-acetyltransferase [Muribaculaceae bacterium]
MNRLRLRAVEPEDADFMMEVENDMDAWIYADTVAPFSHEQLLSYAMTYTADPKTDGQLRLILEKRDEADEGKAVGIVDLYDINERHAHAFIGIYIIPSARHLGYGRRGVEMMAGIARKFLNLNELCAKIADINGASMCFFSSCGFLQSGTLPGWIKISGKRHDLHLLTLNLERDQEGC